MLGNKAIQAAIQAGNVNVAGSRQTVEMELSEGSKAEFEAHSEMLRKLEAQKRARQMVVPTAVEDVKSKLRALGHPVTLFGEGHFDRRERLKLVLAQLELDSEQAKGSAQPIDSVGGVGDAAQSAAETQQHRGQQKKEAVYTTASPELIEARARIAAFSFPRARQRLEARRQLQAPAASSGDGGGGGGGGDGGSALRATADAAVKSLYEHSKALVLSASAAAEERPLVSARFSPSGLLLATGSLGPGVKLWEAGRLEGVGSLRGHEERVMSLAWQPRAGLAADAPELLASVSADGLCLLWDCRPQQHHQQHQQQQEQVQEQEQEQEQQQQQGDAMAVDGAAPNPTPAAAAAAAAARGDTGTGTGTGTGRGVRVATLSGHRGPVADVDFHPSGRLLGTAGHDNTWRLWDVETQAELLMQDGHVKECSTIAFQADGALCLTGDAAGVALLWDLRSGQAVHVCQGHVKKIT